MGTNDMEQDDIEQPTWAVQRIWKFAVPITDRQTIDMPQGAQVLSVQMQDDDPCVWALVDPDKPLEPRQFRWYGTGHPFDIRQHRFVGTVQITTDWRALVFHLFEALA